MYFDNGNTKRDFGIKIAPFFHSFFNISRCEKLFPIAKIFCRKYLRHPRELIFSQFFCHASREKNPLGVKYIAAMYCKCGGNALGHNWKDFSEDFERGSAAVNLAMSICVKRVARVRFLRTGPYIYRHP